MNLLFNWRVWVVAGLAIVLAFTHTAAYRKGESDVRTEWQVSVAAANVDARKLEHARQRRAEEAGRLAAGREADLRRAAARSVDAVRGLRDAIAAERLRNESSTAAAERAATYGELLGQSAEAYRELAATCDRHVNDVRLLLEAWPSQ